MSDRMTLWMARSHDPTCVWFVYAGNKAEARDMIDQEEDPGGLELVEVRGAMGVCLRLNGPDAESEGEVSVDHVCEETWELPGVPEFPARAVVPPLHDRTDAEDGVGADEELE